MPQAKYTPRADGRYQAKVWDGTYTAAGRKHYIYLYSSKSSRDLEKKVKEYEASLITGTNTVTSDSDVYQYALNWLKTSKSLSEAKTYDMYRHIIEKYMADFKGASFKFWTYPNLQKIINDNASKARTCQQIRLTLKQISKAAEYDRLIPKGTTEEIFDRIQIPKYKATEKRPLSDYEKSKIPSLNLCLEEKAMVYLLYYTGMRKEELLALHISDIGEKIAITKAVGNKGEEPYLKGTKTSRGVRSVPLTAELRKTLSEYIPTVQGDILFPWNGGYMKKSVFYNKWDHIRAAFGTDITPHLFRHNFCTQLCYQAKAGKITTKKIAELLGDTEQMVLNVYSHIIEEKEETETSIEEALKI